MFVRLIAVAAACATFSWCVALPACAQATKTLSLLQALQRADAANYRLVIADRDMGMAAGRRDQAAAIPNPQISAEADNVLGSKAYRGVKSAETTLQISQLIELGGKRDARVSAAAAEYESARWQRAASRLELLSETAVAFVEILGLQRRIQTLDRQIAALDRLSPLVQQRVDAGAIGPADVARTQVAVDMMRIERERARSALATARRNVAVLMGTTAADFSWASGDLGRVARPASFDTVLQAIDANPQLMRFTALRAQRDAELLTARLKPIPDPQVSLGWRHYADTRDNAVRLGVSVPIPVWDRNRGAIREAQEAVGKTEAERGAAKLTLVSTLGRAHDAAVGALLEIDIVRRSVLVNGRKAVEAIESGYAQGRYTLLELLEAYKAVADAELTEIEALIRFHTAIATIEGLTGTGVALGTGGTPR